MSAEYKLRGAAQVVVKPIGESYGQVKLVVEPKGDTVGPFWALPTAMSMLVPGSTARVDNIKGRQVVNLIHPPAKTGK